MSAVHISSARALWVLVFLRLVKLAELTDRINQLDLIKVRAKLMATRHENMSPEEADATIAAYRRFLVMIGVAKFSVVPTRTIDAAWHHHQLHSRMYLDDCLQVFGYFVHHEPADEDAPEGGRTRMEQSFQRTAKLYYALFGKSYEETQKADCCDPRCRSDCTNPQAPAVHRCDGPACRGTCTRVQVARTPNRGRECCEDSQPTSNMVKATCNGSDCYEATPALALQSLLRTCDGPTPCRHPCGGRCSD